VVTTTLLVGTSHPVTYMSDSQRELP
jgi:hypothetical protein